VSERDILTQRERNIATVRFFYNQSIRKFDEIYSEEFAKTKAFREIERWLALNERIDRNLILLDMTVLSPGEY